MTFENRMQATELDRYWDSLAVGERAPSTEPPDGETADLIDRLWAFGAPPDPDVARERVWRRLQQHREREERGMDARAHLEFLNLAPWRPNRADGQTAPRPAPGGGQAWWRSMTGQLATAALLVLALVGGFVTFAPGRPGQESHDSTMIPALSAPPAASETDGVATTLLLDVVIPTISQERAWVQFDHFTFPAATMVDVDMRGGGVPEVFYVVDGALKVQAVEGPQPVRVIWAGGVKAEESLMSGASVTVAAGDAVIVPENGVAKLMNMSAEPANALLLLVPSNVDLPINSTIGYESLIGSIRTVSAPLALTLEQATLAPGAAFPGLDAANVDREVVPLDPVRVMDARIGSNGSLRNAGDEPLEAYVLTVTSGTPVP
jgi:mannose-6-phosphate isomerase-like protein (cupin superfamily)